MEQNFGPHIEQKWAVLAPSAGRVSSWYDRAVSGSSDSSNWSAQRKSKRALERASSHAWAPGDLGQLPRGPQPAEVGRVVGAGDRAGSQPVTQREGDVVGGEDLAQLLEVGVEEVLLVVGQAPGGQDRTAPAHDPGDPGGGE